MSANIVPYELSLGNRLRPLLSGQGGNIVFMNSYFFRVIISMEEK
jgi:hypothetical protein